MRRTLFVVRIGLLSMLFFGCNSKPTEALETPTFSTSPSNSTGLLADTDRTRDLPSEPQISRARFVTVNLGQLIDEAGQSHNVREVTLNLFPDVTYTGVIEQVEQAGDTVSWTGSLKNVQYSYFTMVYTSGVFMGHFGSPQGIYEVVFVEDGLYRVIEIDQTKFPGGEG